MPDRIRASRKPLPTLVVPRGTRQAVDRSDHTPEVQPRGTSLSKLQIRELAATLGPIQAVLPWAVLSARRPYVKDRADALFWKVGHVSGPGDEVNLASHWAPWDAAITVSLPKIQPGQMFIVVFNGWCNGSGVLAYQASLGSGDLPVSQGAFSLPIALTNTDDSAWVKLRVKTAPTLLSVRSMEVWKVD
jgi:hypothetical protein